MRAFRVGIRSHYARPFRVPVRGAHGARPGLVQETTDLDAHETLTLKMTLRGHSLKQVALELGISEGLACRMRREALRKLGAENVYQFVAVCALGGIPGFVPALVGPQPAVEVITRAEYDVARQVVLGHSNAAIARHRGTTERTVANQLASMYRKLKVQSRIELVVLLTSSGAV